MCIRENDQCNDIVHNGVRTFMKRKFHEVRHTVSEAQYHHSLPPPSAFQMVQSSEKENGKGMLGKWRTLIK